MAAEFDIQKLYNYIFGYRGLPFPAFGLQGALKIIPNVPQLFNKGPYGVNYIMPIRFYDIDKKTNKAEISFSLALQNEPLISLTCQKTILKTPLAGNTRPGTVKELINTEDWVISIKGILFNIDNPDSYPVDAVTELGEFFLKNKPIVISCDICQYMNITNVVVENIALAEMKGIENAQAYTISLISDEPFELIKA